MPPRLWLEGEWRGDARRRVGGHRNPIYSRRQLPYNANYPAPPPLLYELEPYLVFLSPLDTTPQPNFRSNIKRSLRRRKKHLQSPSVADSASFKFGVDDAAEALTLSVGSTALQLEDQYHLAPSRSDEALNNSNTRHPLLSNS